MLRPETWRSDLLSIVLRCTSAFGFLVYLPSVWFAGRGGLMGIVALDTVAIAAILALTYFERLPARAVTTCLVFFALGAGLMVGVGSVSLSYLLGFSLLTTLLLDLKSGLFTVLLNAATMLTIGFVGIAAPEMSASQWHIDLVGWSVITGNFVFVNVSLVLVLGVVIKALESALARSLATRKALEDEQDALVALNRSLHEKRALLRIAGQTARLGGWRLELGSGHVVWSDEVCDLFEVPAGTTPTLEEALAFYSPESRERASDAVMRCSRDGAPFDIEIEMLTKSGASLWVRSVGNADRDAAGNITHVHGSVQDVTPRKHAEVRNARLEEQLRQAQKMETIGKLAGGVAHDFNNLLSIILSYSELLADDLPPGDPMRSDLEEIRGAGQRAVELTRQLLAFSRQQVLEPKIVDLAAVASGMENMLRRLLGEDIELTCSVAPGIGKVLVDPGQIEQVILNLAVNARDAMPSGGRLTIETAEVTLDDTYAGENVGVVPGPHVMLAVTDTGTGIDLATQARMFEPFFTTKEKGKGTGLGLATVFGIVQQSGGIIGVSSEQGRGTTFRIHFPVARGAPAALVAAPERALVHGSETILLVEDEEALRVLTRTILRRHGYTVIEAENGGDALMVCEQHASTIHLLLTDVVMPRMGGRLLAERLAPLRPGMKVLYMSGYTDDAVVRHGVLSATLSFIQKPVTPDALLRKVRETLSDG
ncbi:MAG: sensory box histidine kinase/response regulator [Labilithrix sp.]|nr:sensory box histidine kinase/response regulator [Labilithrix sp.]